MKKSYILIALAMVAALSMVSCGNNKKSQNQEPTQEEVQEMKQALADSVLAEIDALYDTFQETDSECFHMAYFNLTEEEKMVKPEYLLDPSFANTLVTKSQKVNALAFYITDLAVRKIYDMPMEEAKEVIAKLAVELNHPIDANFIADFGKHGSEKIKNEYEVCKERGDLAYFWQFQNAVCIELGYLVVQNPELFFSKISEEQWQAYDMRVNEKNKAMRELAKFDEEMTAVLEMFNKTRVFSSDEEKASIGTSIGSTKLYLIENRDKFIAQRNALLQ